MTLRLAEVFDFAAGRDAGGRCLRRLAKGSGFAVGWDADRRLPRLAEVLDFAAGSFCPRP